MSSCLRPIQGRHYPEVGGVVWVERVFRLFLRVSVEWQGRDWPANINRNRNLTPTLTAPDYYHVVDRTNHELACYFTIGDRFRIDEVVGCEDRRACANFNVRSCKCVFLMSRVQDQIGILFSSFGDRMSQWSHSAEDIASSSGQKKVFICCEGLDREFMANVLKYDSYQCIGFQSHFRQCDVDKYSEQSEELEPHIDVEDECPKGSKYLAHRGQFVIMDAAYPEDRRFPLMTYAEVMTREEVECYQLPSIDDESSLLEKFLPLCENLLFFQSEQQKFAIKKMRIEGLVEMEIRHHLGGDHLPLDAKFQYPIPGKDDKSYLKPIVGNDLHFTMLFDPRGRSRKEFIGSVDRVEVIPGNQIEVSVSFSSSTALDLILWNCIQKRNYGVIVRQHFDASVYKLLMKILKREAGYYLDPNYLNIHYPPQGRDKILQMIVCCVKENPEVGTESFVEPIDAPGIPPMNQAGQLMAIRAVFVEKRSLTCIEGPWGTGKTLSIVSIAYMWVRQNPEKTFMICAETNLIVDHITMMLGTVQDTLNHDGHHFLRICRSYTNHQSADKGLEKLHRYAPWLLAKQPDERETEEMAELREKIRIRTEELNAVEITSEDRHSGLKNLKIKQMSYLIRLIERVYMPKLRMMWFIHLNPNIILCTISHGLVFHFGVLLDDEDALVKKLQKISQKLSGDLQEDIGIGDEFSDEEEMEDVEEEPEVKVHPTNYVDPVQNQFNNIACRRYRGIICDESGQILQYVAMSLCLLLDADDANVQMIFVGDHFQLGPHTMAICGGEAQRLLEMSILEILVDENVCASVQFRHTFRAYPSIVKFLKQKIYGKDLELTSMVDPLERQLLVETPLFSKILPCVDGIVVPIIFFNYHYDEEMGAGKSVLNRCEAHIAIVILECLFYKNSIPLSKIMLLAMYESQNKQVKQLLVNNPFKLREDGLIGQVDVRNVDASQGQANDMVILLTTHCNSSQKIGFLKNKQRANIALSRGKHGLIVFGNIDTLSSDRDFWGPQIHKYIEDGCVYDVQITKGLMESESICVKKHSIDGSKELNIFLKLDRLDLKKGIIIVACKSHGSWVQGGGNSRSRGHRPIKP